MNNLSKYKSELWSIAYPSDWLLENNSENISIYTEYGVGTLQLSGYQKDQEVTEDDLMEFVREEVPDGENVREVRLDNFLGFESDYKYTDHYWRMWFLMKKKTVLYVTYNCEFEDKDLERDSINQI